MGNSEKLGLNVVEKALVAILPIILAILGYFLPSLLFLIRKIPFLSDNQLLNSVSGLNAQWILWTLSIAGLLLGIILSMFIYSDILKLEVNKNYITVEKDDRKFDIEKKDISSIFKDRKNLIILNNDSLELLNESTDYTVEQLRETFTRFHYPWAEEDPYIDDYFEWKIDHSELNQQANRILYDRRQALRDDDEKKSKDLKNDLSELGVIVKDHDKKQFVRIIKRQENEYG